MITLVLLILAIIIIVKTFDFLFVYLFLIRYVQPRGNPEPGAELQNATA